MARVSRASFSIRVIVAFLALAVLPSAPAAAYIGPGAGLTAIGTVLAAVAAIFLAIVGFVWYPVKRVLKARRKARSVAAEKGGAASS